MTTDVDVNTRPPVDAEGEDDFIDLGQLARVVWDARQWIVAGTVAVVAAYLALLVAGYALLPVTQTASQSFQLTFDEEYPNKAKFSPDDIIAVPVLEEVYAVNELQRFLDFTRFRNGFFVVKSSLQLDILASEYRSRLAEPRLATADRAAIEEEFKRRRDELLKEPTYTLTFTFRSRRTELPDLLLNKVVTDVLKVWARQAEQNKGVLSSGVVFFSARSLREAYFQASEPLAGADTLRVRGRRLLDSLDALAKIPGAGAARAQDPVVSLADVRARIEDVLALRVAPAFLSLQAEGVAKSQTNLRGYFEARMAEAVRSRKEGENRLTLLNSALNEFENAPRVVPSVQSSTLRSDAGQGERAQEEGAPAAAAPSLIDSLAQLAARKADSKYRRDVARKVIEETRSLATLRAEESYYRDVLATLPAGATGPRPASAAVSAQLELALGELERAVDDLSRVHQLLTTRNLAVPALLYSLTEPFVSVSIAGSAGARPWLVIPLLAIGCLVLFSLVALVRHAISGRQAELS